MFTKPDWFHQKASRKNLISLSTRLIVTVSLFALLFKSLSWPEVWAILTHTHPGVVLVGLAAGLLAITVSTCQWQRLLHAEQIFVDLKHLINLHLVGFAFNQFLPTSVGGDVVKAYYVGRDSGNNTGSVSAVVMARITGFFGMLVVISPALLIWRAAWGNKGTEQMASWLITGCVLILAAIGSLLCFTFIIRSKSIQNYLVWILPHLIREKVVRSHPFAQGMAMSEALSKRAAHPRSMIMAILLGTLFHITDCLNYYSYGLALHLNVPLSFYFMAIPLVSLIAFLPISLNGFGVRESALVSIFSTAGVPVSSSLLLALMMDLQMLVFATCGSYIYLFMRRQVKQTSLSTKPDEQERQPLELEAQTGTRAVSSIPRKVRGRTKVRMAVLLSAVCLVAVSGTVGWWFMKKAAPDVTLYRVTAQDIKLYTGGAGIVSPFNTTMGRPSVYVHVKLPLSYLSQVTLHQTALVYPSAPPHLLAKGKVTTIIQQASPQTDDTFEFWVSVDDNTDHRFLPGTTASVRLERRVHGMIIPRLAIVGMRQDPIVFVFRNQRAYLQHVHLSGFSDDLVVISEGLSNGDQVILVGKHELQHGQIVRVQMVQESEETSKHGRTRK